MKISSLATEVEMKNGVAYQNKHVNGFSKLKFVLNYVD